MPLVCTRASASRTHTPKGCSVRSNTVRRNFTPNNNGYRNQNLYKLDLLFSFDFLLPIKIKFIVTNSCFFLTCKNIFSWWWCTHCVFIVIICRSIKCFGHFQSSSVFLLLSRGERFFLYFICVNLKYYGEISISFFDWNTKGE